VELETNQGQSHRPVLAEEEFEWEKGVLLVVEGGAVIVQVALGEGLGTDYGLDVGHVLHVVRVDNLTANQKLNFIDNLGPVRVAHVCAVVITDGQVHVREEITLLLEPDRGDAAGNGLALDHLALDGVGKVGVPLVVGPVKRNLGLASQPSVLSTDGDELNDTTRHFIL
jgi:hypothetical protein